MTRLFWKLFLALWLSIMFFAMITAWVNATLAKQTLPEPPSVAFERSVRQVETMLASALREGGAAQARQVLDRLPRHIQRHVFIVDAQGHELLGRERVHRYLEAGRRHHVRRRLTDAAGREWELVVLQRADPAWLLQPGFRGILHRLLMAALISAVVSYFLARYLSGPLERLGQATRDLAAGDLGARVGESITTRRDEFGALARDFDDMAARLERLQHANRRLLRDVSHELRSPLARLKVALELARSRGSGSVDAELDRIELECGRLEALVGEVLELVRNASGSQPLRRERIELCALLDELREAAAYEAGPGSATVCVQCEGPLFLDADRELLWRALENLVRNALIHTREDGGVELAAQWCPVGNDVEIRIRDSGPGVPAEHLERIFEAFFRVEESRDRTTGGYGLGMAIAASAIRRHGGRIEALNRPEGGFEVSIRLPAAPT